MNHPTREAWLSDADWRSEMTPEMQAEAILQTV